MNTSRIRIALLTAVALLLAPAWAGAGDRDHSNGFFLRLSLGGGAASTQVDADGIEGEMSGTSGDVNIAIGGIVTPNLAVHATLFGWAVRDPEVEINDVGGTLDGDLAMGGFGIGVTYYLMPANVYISPTVGIGSLTFDAGDVKLESDNGVAVDLTIGKEWWVGRNWGLGVAGSVGLHSIPDPDVDENWTGANFGLRFTATMN